MSTGKAKNFKDASGLECEECHTALKGKAIKCGTCKGVSHLGCTGYTNEQLTVYYITSFQYICKKCLIENKGANGLYSEAMRYISSIKASDGKTPTPQNTKAPRKNPGKQSSSSIQSSILNNNTHLSITQTTRRNIAESEVESPQLPSNQLQYLANKSKTPIVSSPTPTKVIRPVPRKEKLSSSSLSLCDTPKASTPTTEHQSINNNNNPTRTTIKTPPPPTRTNRSLSAPDLNQCTPIIQTIQPTTSQQTKSSPAQKQKSSLPPPTKNKFTQTIRLNELPALPGEKSKSNKRQPEAKEQRSKPQPEKKKENCIFFLGGYCREGAAGKSCKYEHPKLCPKYIQNGTGDRGCKAQSCKLVHPRLCVYAEKGQICRRKKCIFRHLKNLKRSDNERRESARADNQGPRILQRNPVNKERHASYSEVVSANTAPARSSRSFLEDSLVELREQIERNARQIQQLAELFREPEARAPLYPWNRR